jgi:SnoaL-like domain
MTDLQELLDANLHKVFSERNAQDRWAAIERTYADDVKFVDPEGEVVGRRALEESVQKLLEGVPAEFVFEEDGPRYVGTDTAALPWRLGPPGDPAARGIDIVTVRDGRVIVLRTLLASEADT